MPRTDGRVGPQRRLTAKELMLLNCGVEEDSWESLGLKEIQPVHPKGNQSWVFIGRTDVEAETPILWPPHAKSWLIGKDPDAGKDWGQEKEVTENEVAGCITDSMDVSLSEYQEIVKDREAWHAAVHGVAKSWPWLSNWTTAKIGKEEAKQDIKLTEFKEVKNLIFSNVKKKTKFRITNSF